MKKLVLVTILVVLCLPFYAQRGYYYKKEFVELSVMEDSTYYL